MTKHDTKWAAVALTALVGMGAWAGAKVAYNVSLSFGSNGTGGASAALGSVRNNASSVEQMGCDVHTYGPSIGGGQLAYCTATDSSGTFVSCLSRDPAFVNAVRGIKGDSGLEFHWTASGDCMFIRVSDSSIHPPKDP